MGNSWVDAVALHAFTGDVTFTDNGDDALSLLEDDDGSASSRSWSLVRDANAYLGASCYVARTQDIAGSCGAVEISWNVVAGPSGGILSFAAPPQRDGVCR